MLEQLHSATADVDAFPGNRKGAADLAGMNGHASHVPRLEKGSMKGAAMDANMAYENGGGLIDPATSLTLSSASHRTNLPNDTSPDSIQKQAREDTEQLNGVDRQLHQHNAGKPGTSPTVPTVAKTAHAQTGDDQQSQESRGAFRNETGNFSGGADDKNAEDCRLNGVKEGQPDAEKADPGSGRKQESRSSKKGSSREKDRSKEKDTEKSEKRKERSKSSADDKRSSKRDKEHSHSRSRSRHRSRHRSPRMFSPPKKRPAHGGSRSPSPSPRPRFSRGISPDLRRRPYGPPGGMRRSPPYMRGPPPPAPWGGPYREPPPPGRGLSPPPYGEPPLGYGPPHGHRGYSPPPRRWPGRSPPLPRAYGPPYDWPYEPPGAYGPPHRRSRSPPVRGAVYGRNPTTGSPLYGPPLTRGGGLWDEPPMEPRGPAPAKAWGARSGWDPVAPNPAQDTPVVRGLLFHLQAFHCCAVN